VLDEHAAALRALASRERELDARDARIAEAERELAEARTKLVAERAETLDGARAEGDRLRAQAVTAGGAEAQSIVAEGRAEAARIVGEAGQEAQAIRERAERGGFSTGMQQAREQTEESLRELRKGLQVILDDADDQRERLIRETEPQLVELALTAVRKVAAGAMRDEDVLIAVLRAALTRMLDKDLVRIRVSKADLERVRGMESRILESIDGLDRVEVIEDPRIEDGLIAETRHGTVDATVEGQMREIVAAIDRALADKNGGEDR
jgi:flagellar assembly protein FliH